MPGPHGLRVVNPASNQAPGTAMGDVKKGLVDDLRGRWAEAGKGDG